MRARRRRACLPKTRPRGREADAFRDLRAEASAQADACSPQASLLAESSAPAIAARLRRVLAEARGALEGTEARGGLVAAPPVTAQGGNRGARTDDAADHEGAKPPAASLGAVHARIV